jgi:oxygen-dependent protoporphyrinogen oxidase
MERPDVIVVGGGVAGLAYAYRASRAGRKVIVVEREPGRVGGCLHSHRLDDGYWFEMGAHTTYNSYGGLLEMAEATGLAGKLLERGPARARFALQRGAGWVWLTPPKVLLQLSWLEAALHFPAGYLGGKEGKTVAGYFGGLVGPRNYRRVLGPFLAAVPSQSADGFPVQGPGSLFKKRPRREEFPRSFGLPGGLQSLCDAVAALPGIEVLGGVEATAIARAGTGTGFAVTLSDGRTVEAAGCAVATPAPAAAALLARDFPRVAEPLGRIASSSLETLGVVVAREKLSIPEVAFLVASDDLFWSAVTRDTFPDARWRAFAFHFKGGRADRDAKLRRAAAALGIQPSDFVQVVEARRTLPSPALDHAGVVAGIDAALAGERLALTGNYFDGLAIEDCIQRSFAEWGRTAG